MNAHYVNYRRLIYIETMLRHMVRWWYICFIVFPIYVLHAYIFSQWSYISLFTKSRQHVFLIRQISEKKLVNNDKFFIINKDNFLFQRLRCHWWLIHLTAGSFQHETYT